MATKAKGSTAKGRAGTMANQVNRTGGQTRMRRELAAQRRAMGAAGVQRAMTNWGLRQGRGETAAQRTGNVRASGRISGGRNG